jgi:hypothetical protein
MHILLPAVRFHRVHKSALQNSNIVNICVCLFTNLPCHMFSITALEKEEDKVEKNGGEKWWEKIHEKTKMCFLEM